MPTKRTPRQSARRHPMAVHPGEILDAEFLAELDMSQYRLAKAIGVPARIFPGVVDPRHAHPVAGRPEKRSRSLPLVGAVPLDVGVSRRWFGLIPQPQKTNPGRLVW